MAYHTTAYSLHPFLGTIHIFHTVVLSAYKFNHGISFILRLQVVYGIHTRGFQFSIITEATCVPHKPRVSTIAIPRMNSTIHHSNINPGVHSAYMHQIR